MSNKIKNIVVTALFIAFMVSFVGMCTYRYFNPVDTSEAERRPLAQFPVDITWENIVNKKVIDQLEDCVFATQIGILSKPSAASATICFLA